MGRPARCGSSSGIAGRASTTSRSRGTALSAGGRSRPSKLGRYSDGGPRFWSRPSKLGRYNDSDLGCSRPSKLGRYRSVLLLDLVLVGGAGGGRLDLARAAVAVGG